MHHRSPARFLAPLALIAAALAVYLLVQPTSDPDTGPASRGTTVPAQSTTAKTRPSVNSPRRAKSYTVKAGDTLTSIAEKTGLSVEHITDLNPDLDVNTLRVGQRLKLRQ